MISAGVLGASALGALVYRGVTDPHGRSEIDDLTVGRCVDRPSTNDIVYSLPTRSCDKPHDGEVVYVGRLTEWTNEATARQAANSLCFNAAPVIEATKNPVVAEVMSYAPVDEASFRKSRSVQCIAWAAPGATFKAPSPVADRQRRSPYPHTATLFSASHRRARSGFAPCGSQCSNSYQVVTARAGRAAPVPVDVAGP
ncbi:hypothetical protein ACIGO9_16425 [Nocardia asteroides]|uniref:hypothetical protein n=1 Tax=Nocardia asteroides TaxID=1824 RepID=UPI0037C64EC4